MTRQMRWVSLVSLGAAVAVGAVGCLGDESGDGASVSIGAVSTQSTIAVRLATGTIRRHRAIRMRKARKLVSAHVTAQNAS